jgi:hypothetical protein
MIPCKADNMAEIVRRVRDALKPLGNYYVFSSDLADCLTRIKLALLMYARQTGDAMVYAYANFNFSCPGNMCVVPPSIMEVLDFALITIASSA